jgi:ABC-type transporter Mla subunit MlaD
MEIILRALGAPVSAAFGALETLIGDVNFGPAMALLLICGIGAWSFVIWWKEIRPLSGALDAPLKTLNDLDALSDPAEVRATFAKNTTFELGADFPRSSPLLANYQRWRAGLVQLDGGAELRSSVRAEAAFDAGSLFPSSLSFVSNMAVGLGLLFTFAGIVAALTAAGVGLQATDPQASQDAIRTLLAAASAKFFTSVAGLLTSILVRLADRRFAADFNRKISALCQRLEAGAPPESPGELARLHLQELREQTAQMQKFSTDLAVSIGRVVSESFQTAIAPMISSLNSMRDDTRQAQATLRGEVTATLTETAKVEMDKLGTTLERVDEALATLPERLLAATERAAANIAGAGEEFSSAASAAIAPLTNLSQDLRIAAENQIGSMRDEHAKLAAEMGQNYATSVEQLRESIQSTTFEAVQDTRERVEASLGPLVRSLEIAAAAIDNNRDALEKSSIALAAGSTSFKDATKAAADVSRVLAPAAESVVGLLGPLRDVSARLGETAAELKNAATQSGEAQQVAAEQLGETTQALGAAQSSFENAWKNYSDRFTEIDKVLSQAFEQIAEQLGRQRETAEKFDAKLANAVDRFGEALEVISESSEAIHAYAAEISRPDDHPDTRPQH